MAICITIGMWTITVHARGLRPAKAYVRSIFLCREFGTLDWNPFVASATSITASSTFLWCFSSLVLQSSSELPIELTARDISVVENALRRVSATIQNLDLTLRSLTLYKDTSEVDAQVTWGTSAKPRFNRRVAAIASSGLCLRHGFLRPRLVPHTDLSVDTS